MHGGPASIRGATVELTHLERLRRTELAFVSSWFKPGNHVLELGAGSGYQASLLAERGCDVTALDVAIPSGVEAPHYPVQEYDGRNIPLPDSSVDIVFSSHVLEHVSAIPQLLAETRRVMRPDAIAIHILPSSTWRVWTSVAHYPFILKTLIRGRPSDSLVNVASVREAAARHGLISATFKALVHPLAAHGTSSNALIEVWTFRKARWNQVFARSGFIVINASPNWLFYTGYGVFPRMSLAMRRRVSLLLGSSSRTFVLRAWE